MDRLQKMFEMNRDYNKTLEQKPDGINSNSAKDITPDDIAIQQRNIIQYRIANKISQYDLFQSYTRYDKELQNTAQTHAGLITIVMLLAAVKLAIAFVLGVGT